MDKPIFVHFKTGRENLDFSGNYFTALRRVMKITGFFYRQSFAANTPITEQLYYSENKEYNSLPFKLESYFLISTSEQHCSEIKMEVQVCPFGDHVDYRFYEHRDFSFTTSLCYTSLNTAFTTLQNFYPFSF